MTETVYDLAIVGGGINGCGIARDAAGRGLNVLLLEQDDLASAIGIGPKRRPLLCRLELTMERYHLGRYQATALANIFIFVTPYVF